MKVTKGTYYKALFLLIAFSMGTVVSFACSMSSLFHSLHHHNSSATAKHTHTDQVSHEHEHSGHHHEEKKDPESDQKDCCSNQLLQLQQTEKAVSRTIEAPAVMFLSSFILAYSPLSFSFQEEKLTVLPSFVRWRVPPTIQDLRIVIQSFQI